MSGEPNKPGTPAAEPARPAEPMLGVTRYDRVTSFLMSLILTIGLVTSALGAIWVSNQTWIVDRAPPKIEVVDVIEDVAGGGSEEGELDSSLYAPGPEGSDVSSPSSPDDIVSDTQVVEQAVDNLVNAVASAAVQMDQMMMTSDIGSSHLPSGNPRGKGRKRALGKGPGDGGGVKRQERWEITFDPGQTEQEYARQLDYFRVELGVIAGNTMHMVTKLASPRPVARQVTTGSEEKRLYFSWRGGSRRQADLNLLKKAVSVPLDNNAITLQFYPEDTVQLLARLEREYAQTQGKTRLELIRKTKFNVKKTPTGYSFEVAKQEYFGETPTR
jgi:hypothetical protein